MTAGIKVGPANWKAIFSDYYPRVCEVWFRVDWIDRYLRLFRYLRRKNIQSGLHFWGMLPGGIMPNFAFPDPDVREPSLVLVKQTIDAASEFGLTYVNIHPGSYRLSTVNLNRLFMRPVPGRETSSREGEAVLRENISVLHEYAKKRGVILLVETLPAKEPMHWRDLAKGRMRTQDMKNVPVAAVEMLAENGAWITNDLCHTAMDIVSDDRTHLFAKLLEKTKRLAKQTRLIHANTMLPPFNGTDGHLGILDEDFKSGVFPSREQLVHLLSVFAHRDDIWVIPEPFSKNAENTLALEKLLDVVK